MPRHLAIFNLLLLMLGVLSASVPAERLRIAVLTLTGKMDLAQ
jgi:hypothetical protein